MLMKKILSLLILFLFIVNTSIAKEEEEIKIEDVKNLGEPRIITDLPEDMKKLMRCENRKNQKKIMFCYGNKAPRLMGKAFGHSKSYNEKNGDVMIKGMAWFDLYYSTLLWKNRKYINRYRENKYEKTLFNHKKNYDEKIVRTLISTNKGKKSMREALGMSLDLDTETAIKRFWALGELLSLGEPKKNDVHEDMVKRRKLINEYSDILREMEKKLNEKKEENVKIN